MASEWTRRLAAVALAVTMASGIVACDSDPDQVEQDVEEQVDDVEQDVEEQVDDVEQEVRENTP